jgi:hypothetical protein
MSPLFVILEGIKNRIIAIDNAKADFKNERFLPPS